MPKKSGEDIILRQWIVLQNIPRAPKSITAIELTKKLTNQSTLKVTDRMIQRDLLDLESYGIFSLEYDKSTKPFKWYFPVNAQLKIPALSTNEALVFALAGIHLKPLLPESVLAHLMPYFLSAAKSLAGYSGKTNTADWLDKVRVIPVGQPLLAPVNEEGTSPATHGIVYEALLKNERIKIEYRKRGEEIYTTYDNISPLGLVQIGLILYLVCLIGNSTKPIRLSLHRIRNAERLYEEVVRPKNFSLDNFIASGALGVRKGDKISLKVIFYDNAGDHLLESKLAPEQVAIDGPEPNSLEICAPVIWTHQLEWWLQAFADKVQIIEPLDLRNRLRENLERAAGRYATDAVQS